MDQFRPKQDDSPVRELQRGLEDIRAILERFLRGRGVWIVVAVLLALYVMSGFYMVQPGEKGVVLLFGEVHELTDPGLRYRLPKPFMRETNVDVAKVRTAEIGFRSDGGRTRAIPQESLMLTGDENIVDVQMVVQYKVQSPVKFLFGAEQPEIALRACAEVALRGVVGAKTIDYAMTTGRQEIEEKVELYLQKLLNSYDTGLLAEQVKLQEVDAPKQVREAFHDVVRAWEDRERLMKEADGYREDLLPKARGKAQMEIQEAEGYKAQRVIRAKGDAERFTQVLTEYSKAPGVTRERLYLESAETFLPHTRQFIMEGGDSRLLPLLPLTGQPAPAGTSQPKQDSQQSSDKKGN